MEFGFLGLGTRATCSRHCRIEHSRPWPQAKGEKLLLLSLPERIFIYPLYAYYPRLI
jgi:hypothetical protein